MSDIFRSIMNIDENITSTNFNQLFNDLKNQILDLTQF